MGQSSGLCWQGFGLGASAGLLSRQGGNRLAAWREGPVKDTLLGIGLSQRLIQTNHTHTYQYTHTQRVNGKENGGGVQTWNKDISLLIYKI